MHKFSVAFFFCYFIVGGGFISFHDKRHQSYIAGRTKTYGERDRKMGLRYPGILYFFALPLVLFLSFLSGYSYVSFCRRVSFLGAFLVFVWFISIKHRRGLWLVKGL